MQIQVEVSQLVDEIDRIASHAQFNGMNMLTGRFARQTGENVVTASMWLHVGANMDQREQVFIGTMTCNALNVREISEPEQILSSLHPEKANSVDRHSRRCTEADQQAAGRSRCLSEPDRACHPRHRRQEPKTSRPPSPESGIPTWRDEMVDHVKNQILTQAGTAMLAQANKKTQSVLQLLRIRSVEQ